MTYQLARLDHVREKEYTDFIIGLPDTLLFASLQYRDLIRKFTGAEDHYFLALDHKGAIVGALPSFLLRTNSGNVLNSMPFYGSNGGVLCHKENRLPVASFLIGSLNDFAQDQGCIASTLITSPLENDLYVYEQNCDARFIDSRIGQLTPIPLPGCDAGAAVMNFFDSKNRNMVRKAEKSGVEISSTPWRGDFEFLAQTHADNMRDIGGTAKPSFFFECVRNLFKEGREYKIYTARLDGVPIAALLLFYYNGVVEYFTPVIMREHRSIQPLSLIIHASMADASSQGYKWWNWGGTWQSQSGVYQFKKSWGAVDKPYYYYTKLYDESALALTREELLQIFPYFFVLPFDKLASSAERAAS